MAVSESAEQNLPESFLSNCATFERLADWIIDYEVASLLSGEDQGE